jgi:hypothetical protein
VREGGSEGREKRGRGREGFWAVIQPLQHYETPDMLMAQRLLLAQQPLE